MAVAAAGLANDGSGGVRRLLFTLFGAGVGVVYGGLVYFSPMSTLLW